MENTKECEKGTKICHGNRIGTGACGSGIAGNGDGETLAAGPQSFTQAGNIGTGPDFGAGDQGTIPYIMSLAQSKHQQRDFAHLLQVRCSRFSNISRSSDPTIYQFIPGPRGALNSALHTQRALGIGSPLLFLWARAGRRLRNANCFALLPFGGRLGRNRTVCCTVSLLLL